MGKKSIFLFLNQNLCVFYTENFYLSKPMFTTLFTFSSNGQYIVAGSDDGSFFIWEKSTTNIVRVLRGDDSIVNCLQPHPSICMLATSGIDPVVRLWSPRPEVSENCLHFCGRLFVLVSQSLYMQFSLC